MAKLDRPLYGEYATGTLARSLAYRHTFNPPDEPGDPIVTWGTVTKIPFNSCAPSGAQITRRLLYAAAVAAWRALSDEERSTWSTAKPTNLTGFNFFVKLFLIPTASYFGYCVFGLHVFQLAPGSGQPAAADYDSPFPAGLDEFPVLQDGAHSPQAWLFNRLFTAIRSVQSHIIETGT